MSCQGSGSSSSDQQAVQPGAHPPSNPSAAAGRTGPALRFKLGWGCGSRAVRPIAKEVQADGKTNSDSGSVTQAMFVAIACCVMASSAVAYNPAPGYQKSGQTFAGSALAIAPDGKVAVGTDNYSAGNASVKVYSSLAAVGGAPLYTITDPTFKAIAGIEFADNSTLVFGENFGRNSAFKAILGTPGSVTATALAPDNSVAQIADVTVKAGVVYATSAGGIISSVSTNKLYRFEANNTVTVVLNSIGTGYLGGVVTDSAGRFLITDTGPTDNFGSATGPGILRRYDASFAPIDAIPLTGTGAYDVALDSEGDALISTGNTLTQVKFGGTPTSSVFGTFGAFDFPSYLAYGGTRFEPFDGDGRLIVSGAFTNEGSVFVIQTPEPGTLCLLAGGIVVLGGRARRRS